MLILAIFWPALAGVLIFLLPAARSSRSLRAKLCCGALALEFVPVLALCGALEEARASLFPALG